MTSIELQYTTMCHLELTGNKVQKGMVVELPVLGPVHATRDVVSSASANQGGYFRATELVSLA